MKVSSAPKTETSKEQKETLKLYWEEKTMRSTRQRDLINECSRETGLSIRFIKKWIGNYNYKKKGKRHPKKSRRAAGRPRTLNAYNLFCREIRAPDHIRTGERGQQNRWWTEQWYALSEHERMTYVARARAVRLDVATENLHGEALVERQEFISRQLVYWWAEMDKAGLHGLTLLVNARGLPEVTGTSLGKQFTLERPASSHNFTVNLLAFIAEAKQRNLSKDILPLGNTVTQDDLQTSDSDRHLVSPDEESAEEPPTHAESGMNSSSDEAMVNSNSENGAEALTFPESGVNLTSIETVEPKKARKRKAVASTKSGLPGKPMRGGKHKPSVSTKPAAGPSGQHKKGGKHKTSASAKPCSSGPSMTAQQILLPMANGKPPMETGGNLKKPKKSKTNTHADQGEDTKARDIEVGQKVKYLWIMEDDAGKPFEQWFTGVLKKTNNTTYHFLFENDSSNTRIQKQDAHEALQKNTMILL